MSKMELLLERWSCHDCMPLLRLAMTPAAVELRLDDCQSIPVTTESRLLISWKIKIYRSSLLLLL